MAAWLPRLTFVRRCDQYFLPRHDVHSSDTVISLIPALRSSRLFASFRSTMYFSPRAEIQASALFESVMRRASATSASDGFSEGFIVDKCRQAAVLALGLICFVGGLLGEQKIKFLFNVDISVDSADYLQKMALFAVSAVLGYFAYTLYLSNSPFFKRVREAELSFRWMCALTGAFFAVLLIATSMWA